jgi:hypothetical protein
MVAVVQTFGERVNFHPHVHAIVSRGGWRKDGSWVAVAYVDPGAAEKVFRHDVTLVSAETRIDRRGAGAAAYTTELVKRYFVVVAGRAAAVRRDVVEALEEHPRHAASLYLFGELRGLDAVLEQRRADRHQSS